MDSAAINSAAPIRLTTPLTDEMLRPLKVGESVLLSGVIYTARDAAHKRMVETLKHGEDLPMALDGQVIYYVGPAPAQPDQVTGPAGPTTSTRMDSFTLPLLERGLKGMIGKGKRSDEVRAGIVHYGAVYFVAVGGAAALIAARIKQVEMIAYHDLGTEAIHRLLVEDFPVVVGNDVHGGDLFEMGKAQYRVRSTE
ncbi:MAG: Fe-S-containing hydro-lyase [Burkholderiales bacterium]|nr:Fe-S-containing hydro-lyase [Anaerolineae bacterium]